MQPQSTQHQPPSTAHPPGHTQSLPTYPLAPTRSPTQCLLAEYILLWLSFATIMQLGLEVGIGGGIIMAVLYFAYAYAKVGAVYPFCFSFDGKGGCRQGMAVLYFTYAYAKVRAAYFCLLGCRGSLSNLSQNAGVRTKCVCMYACMGTGVSVGSRTVVGWR